MSFKNGPRGRGVGAILLSVCALALGATPAQAADFTYDPPGDLVSGSGSGRVDETVYMPGMTYPMETAPSYPNSQVYGHGGFRGPGGGQCDSGNYSYPWKDNFCESRSWDVPLCPSGNGHQGQDIRPSTCEINTHWCVASESGEVTSTNGYGFYLTMPDGSLFRYLHMQKSSYPVRVGDNVNKGERVGKVSNEFGGTPTTIHLHYDIKKNIAPHGITFVPPYMSLVRSYEVLLGEEAKPCGVIPGQGGVIDDASSCFQLYGPSKYWRSAEAGFMGTLRWTHAYDGDDPSNWARWQMHFEQGGRYKVEAYLEDGYSMARQVTYRLRANGEEQDVPIDQSQHTGWTEIAGDVEFAEGGGQWLAVFDNTGESNTLERRIAADAVRVTRIDGMQPTEDMGMMPTEDMGMAQEDMRDPVDPTPDLGGEPDLVTSADQGGPDEELKASAASAESSCSHSPSGAPSGGLGALLFALLFGRLRRR